jgi:malate dehydrogenase (oxaloacetate-decarboxylating)(NADP+)
MGLSKPVHVLQYGAEVNDIVNVAAVAVVDAQVRESGSQGVEEPGSGSAMLTSASRTP